MYTNILFNSRLQRFFFNVNPLLIFVLLFVFSPDYSENKTKKKDEKKKIIVLPLEKITVPV